MGKAQQQDKNKSHKTLRDKLRKKRQQLKKHKKEKRQKHLEYDAHGKKLKFYQQKYLSKKDNENEIREQKVRKHLQKFIDIYEDDVEDFYDIFKTFDDGGSIDIADVDNEKIRKCLKKMFKYMPLKKKKLEYSKKQKCAEKLETIMRKFVTESMEYYLENGTDSDSMKSESDSDEHKHEKKKSNKIKLEKKEEQFQIPVKSEREQIQELQKLGLYKQPVRNVDSSMGPAISMEDRQKLASMFQRQLQEERVGPNFDREERDNHAANQGEDQFARILSLANTKREQNKKNPVKRPGIDEIPQELLAVGSAQIGQKQPIDLNEIQEYNRIHRPKKLIEQHQEMMKIGKYSQEDPKKRKPFDHERDIVYGGSRKKFMNNGVFFDFKEKMTQPKGTNNFL